MLQIRQGPLPRYIGDNVCKSSQHTDDIQHSISGTFIEMCDLCRIMVNQRDARSRKGKCYFDSQTKKDEF